MSRLKAAAGQGPKSSSVSSLDAVSCRAQGIQKAAWILEDIQQGRRVKEYPSDPEAREEYFQAAEAEVGYRWALILLLVLSALETPSWCNTGSTKATFFEFIDPTEQCTIDGIPQSDVLLSGVYYMPLGYGICIEIYLIFVMARKLLLESRVQKLYFHPLGVTYFDMRVVYFGLAMVLLEAIDSIWFIIVRPTFRFAFIPRTGFLCLLPAVRSIAHVIQNCLGQFLAISGFLVGTILLFAWIVASIMSEIDDPELKGGKFETLSQTVYTMTDSGCTSDFLANFLPSYTRYRAFGLLWLVFLVITQILMLSLVLDTLVNAYVNFADAQAETDADHQVESVFAAFDALSAANGEEELSKGTFLDFIGEFSRSPRVKPIKFRTASIIFSLVDKDGEGTISKREFCDVCQTLQNELWAVNKYSFVRDYYPELWDSPRFQKLRDYVLSGSINATMNMVLTVNLGLVVAETFVNSVQHRESVRLDDLEVLFSLLYVAEVIVKLSVLSWSEYSSDKSNLFDFSVTWLLLFSSIAQLEIITSGGAAGTAKQYLTILRLLRLLRVAKKLERLKAVKFMIHTITSMVTASSDMMAFMGVVLFFFTTLSVQLWGGLLHPGNPDLRDSDYAASNYWVFNFHDPPIAFGYWTVNLFSGYMGNVADAVYRSSAYPSSWLLFPFFYVSAVSVVFQLVMAFTINVFTELYTKKDQAPPHDENLERLSQELESRSMALHYTIMGNESATERALGKMSRLLDDEEDLTLRRRC